MTWQLWCGIGILVYLAIALPVSLYLGRIFKKLHKYYPEVTDE